MGTSSYNTAPSPISSFLLGAVICSAILLATLPGGNLINLAVSVAFVGVILFNAIAGKRALWFSPELLILVAWLCYSMIGTLMAVDTGAAMFKSITMLQVLVLAFCVQQVVIWNRGSSANLIVYGIAVSISYLITFTQFSAQELAGAESVAGDVSRVASTLNDENTFGAVALMAFTFVLIALAQNIKKAAVLPLGFLLILLFAAIVNSGSRTAFLAGFIVVVGSIWAFRLWRATTFGKFLFTGTVVFLICTTAFFLAKSIPKVEDRLDAVFSVDSRIANRVEGFISVLVSGDTKAESGNSIDERVSMISNGLEVISEYPIVGVGLDNFRTVTGAGTYAHSNLVEIAVSTGLIGFTIYHFMYVVLTLRLIKLFRFGGATGTVARLSLVGLMAYFMMDITRVSYYEKTSWIYFSMLCAIAEVHSRNAKELLLHYTAKRKLRRRRKKSPTEACSVDDPDMEFSDIDEFFDRSKS